MIPTRRFLSAFLVLALASVACSVSLDLTGTPAPAQPATDTPASVPTDEAAPTPEPVATDIPPTPVPALAIEQLRNAEVKIAGIADAESMRTIQLTDGRFESGSDPAVEGYVNVAMGAQVAFGDLNGDDIPDAAIIIGENYGGTGNFVSVVAMLNQGGQPVFAGSALIDDRPIINSVAIQNGEILVDSMIHGPNDPGCCPAQPVNQSYRLWDGRLVLSHFISETPSGVERIINIESPLDGAEVSGAFTVTGSFTISPFENNLSYSVFLEGTPDPIAQAGLMVNALEMGGPGTFELPLDFSAAGTTGNIRIEISDLSAADGSYLALDTLFITVK
jgi:hypothetical protein